MPLSTSEIEDLLPNLSEVVNADSTTLNSKCPACRHQGNKFYLNQSTGTWYCFHCQTKRKDDLMNGVCTSEVQENKHSFLSEEFVRYCSSSLTTYKEHAFSYLMSKRNLSIDTIKKFNIGYYPEEDAITIPSLNSSGVSTISMRYLNNERQRYKSFGTKGLFNEVALEIPSEVCILCEGELNAISAMQLLPMVPAFATQGKSVIKEDKLKALNKYRRIYISFDEDADVEVLKIADIFGPSKVFPLKFDDDKDINDLLKEDNAREVLIDKLKTTKPISPPLLCSISDRVDSCLEYFGNKKYKSFSTGFSALDRVSGGIRPGEFYIITGDSGLGKSTLTCRLGLELAKQGCKTTICSLEMPFESHIAPKLVSFIMGVNVMVEPKPITPEVYKKSLEWIAGTKAINLVNRIGTLKKSELQMILDEVYESGYKCLILDHLQFMVAKEENDEINSVVRIIVDFLKVHLDFIILLVAHSRKPRVDFKRGIEVPLTMHDLKGSSSLYQEPDNIWILNRDEFNNTNLTIGKLRADKTNQKSGTKVNVLFNKGTFTYEIV